MPVIRYGSLCSGIEAATVAWHPLGWTPAWFSQFDPAHNYKTGPDFPSAVLAHRYPQVPNLGDMTSEAWMAQACHLGDIDVLVGGTPCQAFSVAGLRKGLDDARGQLSLRFVDIANAADPSIILWENVPGVLSDKTNGFGCLLAGLAGEDVPLQPPGGRWSDAGCVFGPQRTVAWRILDAQYFGVAQRRRRVFVVASPTASGICPCEILFEFDGTRRDSAPSRSTREEAAPDARGGAAGCDLSQRPDKIQLTPERSPCLAPGTHPGHGAHVVLSGSHWDDHRLPHPTLSQSHNTGAIGYSNQEVFAQRGSGLVPFSFEPTPINMRQASRGANISNNRSDSACSGGPSGSGIGTAGDPAPTLATSHVAAVCHSIHENQRAETTLNDTTGTLKCSGGKPGQGYPAVLYCHSICRGSDPLHAEECAQPITRRNGDPGTITLGTAMVRRLTPIECERLQGFPDDYTAIPWRKGAAPEGQRYKALGNSMAVPVMAWIGARIDAAFKKANP